MEGRETGTGAGTEGNNVESWKTGTGTGTGRNDVESGKAGVGRSDLGHRDLSERIIAAAIAVHAALGPGFVEKVYENALCVELAARGLRFEQQKPVRIVYRDIDIAEHRLDLVVEEVFLVELKAVREIEDIFFMIARSQMRAAKLPEGLILNFASVPLTIKRVGPGPR